MRIMRGLRMVMMIRSEGLRRCGIGLGVYEESTGIECM